MDLPIKLARRFAEMAGKRRGDESADPAPSEELPAMSAPLFRVSNHHAGDGQCPAIDGDEPGMYYGYFTNEYGEQAIFARNSQTGAAFVRMGNAGWDGVHRAVDGRLEDVIVTESEAAWIRACWLSSAGLVRKNR